MEPENLYEGRECGFGWDMYRWEKLDRDEAQFPNESHRPGVGTNLLYLR